ncbi:MAG: hypothetical protein WDM90_15510 [Ferruginibacter sp.]
MKLIIYPSMQKNIRFIAVDDDVLDLLILKEYAADFSFLEHCGGFYQCRSSFGGNRHYQTRFNFFRY